MPALDENCTIGLLSSSGRRSTRRQLLSGAVAALCLTSVGGVYAQAGGATYPDHLIRIIVPYTPGSIGDLFIRPITQQMGQQLGQSVIVENRPGASQAIGAELAAQAAPDGYTLFMGTQSGFVLNRAARKHLPFNPEKDFTPITMLFTAPMYMFVSPSVPAKSVKELIELARAKPGSLTFASIGPGTSSHLAGELFKTMAGVDMLHVPYRGGPDATTAVVTGQVDVMFNGGNALPQMTRGKVRPLAFGSLKRSDILPELPTLDESGLPGYDVSPWFGLFAPAGTPPAIIAKLNATLMPLLKSEETLKRGNTLGLNVSPTTPEKLGAVLKADYPIWEKIMRQAGIQPE